MVPNELREQMDRESPSFAPPHTDTSSLGFAGKKGKARWRCRWKRAWRG